MVRVICTVFVAVTGIRLLRRTTRPAMHADGPVHQDRLCPRSRVPLDSRLARVWPVTC